MRYLYILLVILLSGCMPKNKINLSHEEKNTEEIDIYVNKIIENINFS